MQTNVSFDDLERDDKGSLTFLDAQVHAARTVRPNRWATIPSRVSTAAPAPAAQPSKWIKPDADVIAYINQNAGNYFFRSLQTQFNNYGTLSIGQIEACRKGMHKPVHTPAPIVTPKATGIDLRNVPEGMYAVPNGATRLKIRIDKPENTPDKATKWHGFIFVSDGAEYGQRRKYGMQKPSGSYSGQIENELRAIAADPQAASAAYGKLVGCCGVCGRKLEDEQSVAKGIGPTCAKRLGWT